MSLPGLWNTTQEEAASLHSPQCQPPHLSLYATGALSAIAPELNPRRTVSTQVPSPFWALSEESPENPTVSSAAPTPTGFYSQKIWGLISLALEPWAGWLVWGWDPLLLKYPSRFFSTMHGCGTTRSASSRLSVPLCVSAPLHAFPCLSVYLHISILLTHLDDCGFFKSLVVGLPYSLIF